MKKTMTAMLLLALLLAGCPGGPSDLEVSDEINAMRDQQILDWREEVSSGPGTEAEKEETLHLLNIYKAGDWMDTVDNMHAELSEVAREHWDEGPEARKKAMRDHAMKKFKEDFPEHN